MLWSYCFLSIGIAGTLNCWECVAIIHVVCLVFASALLQRALELITRHHEAILSVAFSVGKVLLTAMKDEKITLTIKLWSLVTDFSVTGIRKSH
jgi:WD40 repeat protein